MIDRLYHTEDAVFVYISADLPTEGGLQTA